VAGVLLLPLGLAGCVAPRAQLSGIPRGAGVVSSGLASADDDEIAWVCPMHADYTSDKEGKCPRCGMALVSATPFDMRDYHLDFETVPAVPKAGEPVTLKFNVFHPGTLVPVKKFEPVHDRLYHLFVISQDMTFFQHIHPEESEDGTWSIDVTLPRPGHYAVLSDFLPSGGSSQFLARPLVTAGYAGDIMADSAHLVPDTTHVQTVDDLRVSVDIDPAPLTAGSYGHLTFHLKNAKTDEPVRDLQTYLGAFGHTLIMSEDMVDYVHSHPVEAIAPDVNLEDARGGPDVMFEGLMPRPGIYRAWTQFRYHYKIHTFTTTFEVRDIGQKTSH